MPETDRRQLLRRVTLDLTGLPPTLEEQETFLKDTSPLAYKRLVDRLLASPAYGERQAQHWLDAVRFAESNGFELDGDRPHAWRYRDYVVKAFNDDLPYDRFLTEQIAGDELAVGKEPVEAARLRIATGFHRCGPVHIVSGNIDPEVARQEVLTEFTTGVGSVVLGLTVHCARCHDHKFDPVSQAEYYRLEAFFAGTRHREIDFSQKSEQQTYKKAVDDLKRQIAPITAKIEAIDAPLRKKVREAKLASLEPAIREAIAIESKKRTKAQQQLVIDSGVLLKVTWDEIVAALSPAEKQLRESLRAEQHALEARMPEPPPTAWSVEESDKTPPTHILKRGEVKKKLQTVSAAVPRVLGELPASTTKPTRLDLAKWLTRPDHPLTARVYVNRIWQQHFGTGLVATANDFGLHGEKPSHPELLDWLASEFVAQGWKTKTLHRLIVTSQTYRQSSRATDDIRKLDPDNRLLSRMPIRRLDGEAIRDAMLAVSGMLNRDLGGPSVRVPLEKEVYDLIFTEGEPDGLWHVTPDVRQHSRRSLYLFAKRTVRQPIFETFDQPDRSSPCANRSTSTFAPQALILMNGPLSQQLSRAFAGRLIREAGAEPAKQIDLAYRLAFGRSATEAEIRTAREFLEGQASIAEERLLARQPVALPTGLPEKADLTHAIALVDFCLALFNSNEFVHIR